MAPILNIFLQWLQVLPASHVKSTGDQPTFHNLDLQQQPIIPIYSDYHKSGPPDYSNHTVSSVARIKNRLDVFGLVENNLAHKFWDGHQWEPTSSGFEILGNGLASPPVAISWGGDRLDVFGLDDHDVIKHQFWDGTAWLPSPDGLENLGAGCDGGYPITATTWGQDRLDLFCRGKKGDLRHQYYDGSQWQPETGSTESLGGLLATAPSVLSWAKDRLDIFALDPLGQPIQLYWDGNRWSDWIYHPTIINFYPESFTATSWGENRLDLWAVERVLGGLSHKYWDGSQWSEWESLGVTGSSASVSVSSWSANRLDIVASSGTGEFLYKFYDGQSWQPDAAGWYEKGPLAGKGPAISSNPSVVSWGENRLDFFGESESGMLLHQSWTGSDWYPGSNTWEDLGRGLL